ncbi:acyl-CoA reductase [Chryseolinea lacunae]|uniref:Acyl-CoA reductase n=1 Tax=Chryseolinea lacunae TaxID=2801331 RepID=A0ABS1KWI4_9BACT|nr:acyl-CoA reductase [Chryseolinea lacunae]MBL0743823.1 acyl-CoA reductase [Chryseolinea lacunae]
MKVEERIVAFGELGRFLGNLDEETLQSLALSARNENPWFTEESIRMAVSGITKFLTPESLRQWTSAYTLDHQPSRQIAVVMAGNIPLVGFHDFLCVLITGHSILIKKSSKDGVLISFLVKQLIEIEPRFESLISYGDMLKGFDAIIATGSDNASRYFEYYFAKYPHIIRKNRTSVAVLRGNESEADLATLGIDVFTYFGLGCRNVSKLFVPEGYDLGRIYRGWDSFREVVNHHKYANNYDYQKSILLVSQTAFLDNGFVILQENQKLVSPISVMYYEYYSSPEALEQKLEASKDKIQCTVDNIEGSPVKFGEAQFPDVRDYADQVDTLKFLTSLS